MALKQSYKFTVWLLALTLLTSGCQTVGQKDRLEKQRQQAMHRQVALEIQRRGEAERQARRAEQESKRWAQAKLELERKKEERQAQREREAQRKRELKAKETARLVKQKAEEQRRAEQARLHAEKELKRQQQAEAARLAKRKAKEQELQEKEKQRQKQEEQRRLQAEKRQQQAEAARLAKLQAEQERQMNQQAIAMERQLETAWKAEAARHAREASRLARLKGQEAEGAEEAQRRRNEVAGYMERQLEAALKEQRSAQAKEEKRQGTIENPQMQFVLPLKGRILSPKEVSQDVYRLQLGDEVSVSVWGHGDLSVTSPIRENGTFSFPLIGEVLAVGQTLKEVEQTVQERLDMDFIVRPQVTARLIGAKFSIFGEIEHPGSYAIEGFMDLLTAISIAGGITKFGSSSVEIIRRRGNEKVTIRVNIDRIVRAKEPNVIILPHDTIHVKRRLF